ncbi:MAG: ABC transporter ATP-binding protein [Acidimicrobiia bacterium]
MSGPRPAREGAATAAPDGPAVRFAGLHHAFGETTVLQDVGLDLPRGQFCSVVGPSGCGKTTLLNMIAGEIAPDQGTVEVLGEAPRFGRHEIAYMFARDALYPWRTAVKNVALGLQARGVRRPVREARAREVLSAVGLGDFYGAYPTQLSQGMRQRVALARTFAISPDLLLMDEPFAALDAQTRLLLEDHLIRLWETEKCTVLFVTHDLAEAIVLADRVVVMTARPGRIKRIFDVPLERPRSARELQGSPEFHALYESIWTDLEEEVEHL